MPGAQPRPIPVYIPLIQRRLLLSAFIHTPAYAPRQVFIRGRNHGLALAGCGSGSVRSDLRLGGGLRAPARSGAVNGLYLLGGLMALALAGYLVYALLRAEDF